jgi:hypothetical protein
MPNYQNAKIYELVCLTTGLRYIGSTTERFLSSRLATHVRDCKIREHPCTAVNIIEGGNYKINLLLAYPCNDVNELRAKEYEFMKNMECVNKLRGVGRNKEKEREYKLKNKDAINAKRREWRLKKKIPAVGFDPTSSEFCPDKDTNASC